jgi:multiple sugar transport system ATP-binding protein
MADVTLTNISKTYPGGVVAVHNTSLQLRHGELTVLVGPSGCGKSTLLRMVAGLESITHGTVAIGGVCVNDAPARDRDVAMVFQNYALYPHMTVRRNMSFGLLRRRKHGGVIGALFARQAWKHELDEINLRVEETARSLDIFALLDRHPRALSGGQRQRVALGRALVRQPRVFLFDEPLSNLDARLRIEMRAEIRSLHRQTGATMIYVTHDQEEAMTLADRMVVMRAGEVQQFDTPGECYARPANRFVAAFVGVPVMNFFDGSVHAGAFQAKGLSVPLPAGRWGSDVLSACPQATLGVRPDQIRVSANAQAAGAVPALLEAIEQLGDRMDLVMRAGSHRIVARVSPDLTLKEGDAVGVHMDTAQAHLYEPGEAGKRILTN